jgi:hypothetical protein
LYRIQFFGIVRQRSVHFYQEQSTPKATSRIIRCSDGSGNAYKAGEEKGEKKGKAMLCETETAGNVAEEAGDKSESKIGGCIIDDVE